MDASDDGADDDQTTMETTTDAGPSPAGSVAIHPLTRADLTRGPWRAQPGAP